MPAAFPIPSQSILEESVPSTEQTLASSQEAVESSRSEKIARLAYVLWQQRGCPPESAEADYFEAEQQLGR